ncbi:MAG: glycosyltransferase family 4 protein [bacterium]|nr:glycosyltransferase family 4 protein [bacterium]
MRITKIAYITETAPGDKHAWSGTVHYVYKALREAGFNVIALGPGRPVFIRYLLAVLNKISLFYFRKRFDYRHSKIYSRAFGRLFSNKLKQVDYDCIVLCGSTEIGAYLKADKPVYYILDRTIEGAINYHTILSNLWKFSERQSIYTDKKAMLSSTKVFFSSQWAADHAKQKYQIPERKIRVIPFGANLDKVPDRATALKEKTKKEWKLLLIGTYWLNKGADIAYNTLLILLQNNVNVSLTVVGCTPPEDLKHKNLTIIPFVDKNSVEGLKTLWDLFLSHHFFILPTRFDCTPIVFCEASSFGLPILSSHTGGVEGHIKEGVNGFLISHEDSGAAYAQKISEIINKPGVYEQLCLSSRDFYESQLNWAHWTSEFSKEIKAN